MKNRSDLGLYIHIPFCRRRCHYCHFNIKIIHPNHNHHTRHDQYLNLLEIEISNQHAYHERTLTSIYVGGGTPSQLSRVAMQRLMGMIKTHFSIADDCEITCEVNPDDVNHVTVNELVDIGFTRISLGVQSFQDACLDAVRRTHDAAQAHAAMAKCRNLPDGTNADLMLGLPHQSLASLDADLEQLLSYGPEHISIYLLERDLPIPLEKSAPADSLPDDDQQADWYLHVDQVLGNHGYDHYEISNFARPGYASRHNLNYWQSGDYLGLGHGAHSRIGNRYWHNHQAFDRYQQALSCGNAAIEHSETWDDERLLSERIIQGLRLRQGIPTAWVPVDKRAALDLYRTRGWLTESEDRMAMTVNGWIMANEIFAHFL